MSNTTIYNMICLSACLNVHIRLFSYSFIIHLLFYVFHWHGNEIACDSHMCIQLKIIFFNMHGSSSNCVHIHMRLIFPLCV